MFELSAVTKASSSGVFCSSSSSLSPDAWKEGTNGSCRTATQRNVPERHEAVDASGKEAGVLPAAGSPSSSLPDTAVVGPDRRPHGSPHQDRDVALVRVLEDAQLLPCARVPEEDLAVSSRCHERRESEVVAAAGGGGRRGDRPALLDKADRVQWLARLEPQGGRRALLLLLFPPPPSLTSQHATVPSLDADKREVESRVPGQGRGGLGVGKGGRE